MIVLGCVVTVARRIRTVYLILRVVPMFDVPPHAMVAMCAVFGLLVLASVVSMILAIRHPDRDYTERLRIQSWWWMIGSVFIVLAVGLGAAIRFFGFCQLPGRSKNSFRSSPRARWTVSAIFWAYVAIPVQYYWIYIDWYGMFIIFVPVYLFLFLPMRMVLIGENTWIHQVRRRAAMGRDAGRLLP
ncbi:MAG: hypothetical protein R3C10_05365 [Pirellulales bacterium]